MRRAVICIAVSLTLVSACEREAPANPPKAGEPKPTAPVAATTPANGEPSKVPANTELAKIALDVVPKLEGEESKPVTLSAAAKCSNGEPVSFAWLQVGA